MQGFPLFLRCASPTVWTFRRAMRWLRDGLMELPVLFSLEWNSVWCKGSSSHLPEELSFPLHRSGGAPGQLGHAVLLQCRQRC